MAWLPACRDCGDLLIYPKERRAGRCTRCTDVLILEALAAVVVLFILAVCMAFVRTCNRPEVLGDVSRLEERRASRPSADRATCPPGTSATRPGARDDASVT